MRRATFAAGAAVVVAGCASLCFAEEPTDDPKVERPGAAPAVRSLDEIKASGVLRLLVRNNATSFLVYRGHRLGFDYELGKRLAQSLGVRAQFVVPPLWDEIVPALLRGDGDVIAGEMTVTDERARQLLFSRPYLTTSERVVSHRSHRKQPPIATPEDLSGLKVTVRRSSAYWQSLEALNARLQQAGKPTVELLPAAEDMETEDLLELVAHGELPVTIADELIAKVAVASNEGLLLGPALGEPRPIAWAVRPGETGLAAAIDSMFAKEKKTAEFNIWKRQYFETPRQFTSRKRAAYDKSGRLSPYDPLIIAAARKYGFDWRLVAAQIYQESQFDPKRESWCGAQGLFQIMPNTAALLGVTDPVDPAQGIDGGAKYMNHLVKALADVPDPVERYKMALASYNCGPGHVEDARELLKAQGQPAETWDQVREALLALSKERVHRHTKYGFCRCSEPVAYVQKIQERFEGYKQLIPEATGK